MDNLDLGPQDWQLDTVRQTQRSQGNQNTSGDKLYEMPSIVNIQKMSESPPESPVSSQESKNRKVQRMKSVTLMVREKVNLYLNFQKAKIKKKPVTIQPDRQYQKKHK